MPSTTAPPRRTRAAQATCGVLAVLAALCTYLLGAAPPAAAHAVLTGSTPTAGAVVDGSPEELTLTFSEAVQLSEDSVRVLGPDGTRADTGGAPHEAADRESAGDSDEPAGNRYGTPLRDGLRDGTYTVAWQAVSADSHPISGAFTFSVGAPSKTSVTLPDQEAGGGTTGLLYDTARYGAYAGFLLLVGGATFVLTCWPRGVHVRAVQRAVTGGWVALTSATLAMLLLRTPYTGSGELTDAFDLNGLGDVVGTGTGTALVSRLLLLAAAALCITALFGTYARTTAEGDDPARLNAAPRPRRLVPALVPALCGGVVATGLALTWAASEHASTGIQTAVAMPVDVLHLLAAAVWLGGLATLAATLRSGTGAIPRTAVHRFSRLAPASVAVLAVTGSYQSWRQVGSWSALTGTDYGRLLLVKLALIGALLAAARGSRRWTNRLSEQPPAPSPAALLPAPDAEPAPNSTTATGTVTREAPSSGSGAHPARAAQLARQREALETARRRRARDADPDRRGLRRTVLTETALALAVLAVTTLLSGAEPARTAETTATIAGPNAPAGPHEVTVPFDTGGPNGNGTAEVVLDPGRTGRNTLDVRLTDPSGKPLAAPEVKVSFTLPAKDLGPLRTAPREDGPGHWHKTGLPLPVPGAWEMALTIRTSDIDQTTQTRTVRIG
ncbi:hypothetical protein N566_12540 [Streptomycetaceae bacterium MP113-05]|nr:hypothetical protein N566_12540 [Streptomycetaceae bacterium MP113-05]